MQLDLDDRAPPAGASLTLVSNGDHVLAVSSDELHRVETATADLGEQRTCEQCATSFEPRKGTGGRPQRYCSPACRAAANKSKTLANDAPTAPDHKAIVEIFAALAQEREAEPREPYERDVGNFWTIEPQDRIEVEATDDGVAISLINDAGGRQTTIAVGLPAAVRLARFVLWAAGFKAIGIYVHTDRGNVDLEDGAEAVDVYR